MVVSNTSVIKKLLILFLFFAGLYFAKDFLMPLSIGAVLATLFLPFCNWLEAKKVPRGLASLICLLFLLLLITSVGYLFGWLISDLTSDIELVKQKGIEAFNRVQEYIFNHIGVSADKQSELLKNQQPSFNGIIPGIAGSLAYIFSNLILVLAYIFFLLYYRVHLKMFIIKLAPKDQQKEMSQVISSVTQVSQQYLFGLAKMIGLLWVMYAIGFKLAGVNNAISFAILCGMLEVIPFIGNLTGTTITILVSAMQGASLPMLGSILGTYGLVQFIQGWILEPMIVGQQVKINPLFTIIALLLGELVWGIPGIFLAIPLTAMFKIVCDHIDSLKPYGFLIGEIESDSEEPGWIKRLLSRVKRKK